MKVAHILLEKLKHNFLLKLLSVFVATLLWMAVINIEDPMVVITIKNVPVTILHEQVILESGKIPEILGGDTVDVVVQTRKSIGDKLTKDDIIAVADFENMSITNSVPIEVSVNKYNDRDVEILRGHNQFVKLSLDEFVTKEFKVKVVTIGDPRSGYVVASNVASPNVVTVSGSKTQISRITDVIVNIDATDKYAEFSSNVRAVAIDGNNEVVKDSKITISTDSISVRTLVYATKELLIDVKLKGETNEDYEVTGISVQPTKVMIAGLKDDLAKIPLMQSAFIDVEGATATVEANINVLDLIDKSLYSIIAVGDSTVAIKVDIDRQQVVQRLLPATDITLKNVQPNLSAQVVSLNQRMIKVQGKKDVLEDLTAYVLGAYIDVTDYMEPGEYENVPVYFDTLFGVKVLTELTVTVKLEATLE